MNADFQAAHPRLSAVNLIVPTCNVTVSFRKKLFIEYTLLQIFEIMLIFSIILLIQNNISLNNSENFLQELIYTLTIHSQ